MKSCLPGDKRVLFPVLRKANNVVTKVNDLLLTEEADYLIQKAQNAGLHRSTVGQERDLSRSRTSSTAFLQKNADEVVSCIENRIASVADQPVENLEPLQVTAYEHKQKYDAHYDASDDDRDHTASRTITVFSYLNTVDEACGGATAFPLLKDGKGKEQNKPFRVYPQKGNAVMWSNKTKEGQRDKRTLHAGEPVTCSNAEKYGLNAWFQDKPWD